MKKLVSLLLALALLLTAAVCVAEGSEAAAIGSPDNPVVVRYLCKDVDPSDPDVQTYVQQISEKMAALGQYVTIEVMEAPAGTYADAKGSDIVVITSGVGRKPGQGRVMDRPAHRAGETLF